MKAMILAAGLGTRLHPLTASRPKALVPIINKPMIAWVIEYLKSHSVGEIIVNTHHHGRMLSDYLGDGHSFGIRIETRREPVILGTGGGIKNTEDFWDNEPFFVSNADILTDIDLGAALRVHLSSKAAATLVLHDLPVHSKVLVDREGFVTDIGRDVVPGRLAFTGTHVLEPSVLKHIPAGVFYDIMDCYRTLIRSGIPLKAFVANGHFWHDVGTVRGYLDAHRDMLARLGERFVVAEGCSVHPSARLRDWAVLGRGAEVEERAVIERSVVWEGAVVKAGVRISDSVVGSGIVVERDLHGGFP